MDNKTQTTEIPQKGNILVINTGSTTTKLGYFSDGTRVFDTKLEHTAEDVAKYPSVMDQADMRHQAIKDFMASEDIPLEDTPLDGDLNHMTVAQLRSIARSLNTGMSSRKIRYARKEELIDRIEAARNKED